MWRIERMTIRTVLEHSTERFFTMVTLDPPPYLLDSGELRISDYCPDPILKCVQGCGCAPGGLKYLWLLFICLQIQFPLVKAEENWPRFRGPTAMGVADDDKRLPEIWDKTKNVVWHTDIPGWGWSNPIVWDDRVFLTTVVSDKDYEAPKAGLYLGGGRQEIPEGVHQWLTYCLDIKTGMVLWRKKAHEGEPQFPRHPKSTYASETPTTDGERLYVLFGDLGLYCYDFDGGLIWSVPIEGKKTYSGYGTAASPVVHGEQVIMIYDNQEESYIASYDTKTGKERWRSHRDEKSTWATPLVWENRFRTEIVTSGRQKIRSYDLDGQVLWELNGRMSNLIIPSPFEAFGMVYITSGYVGDQNRPVYAIQPGAAGDITLMEENTSNEFIQWFQPRLGPYNTSPIVYGDYYYTLYDRGLMSANDAHTGREIYDRIRFPVGTSFTASPWAYNGKIFCLAENGNTFVLHAGPEFKILQANDLEELTIATPAVCQGKLLIRTASKVYCISNLQE